MNRRGFLLAAGSGLGVMSISLPPALIARMTGDVLPPARTPEPASWSDNGITLAWLGHATVLINFYGVRILTDPALFPRIGVDLRLTTIGPLRLTACALPAAQLPEIDVVLVSHAHFDHLDTASLGSLHGHPVVVTAKKTADLIPRRRVAGVYELGWNRAARLNTRRGDLEVRAVEVKHKTFRLSDEGFNEPIDRAEAALVEERERLALRDVGDTAAVA